MLPRRFPCFATCAPGLEPLLHAEMSALRLAKVERQVGGCYFEGGLADVWRANLGLRTAVRVLLRRSRFEAVDDDALYAGVAAEDWAPFLAPTGTLRVDAKVRASRLDHSQFVEQRVKDAIVDQFQQRHGVRPSVDKDEPDLRVAVHLYQDRVTLQLDSSGHSLHRRGYRRQQGKAPLAETLAAAMLLASGWDRRAPVVDPFCGSGTLLVEAAMLATGTAPGLLRDRFGFEAWQGHDAAGFARLKDELRAAARPLGKLRLLGSDREPERLDDVRTNLEAAGFGGARNVELRHGDAADVELKPGWNALVATNPPYGERVGDVDALRPVHRALGARLRSEAAGYRVALLTGSPELAGELGLPELEPMAIKNGALDCQLLLGEIAARGQANTEPGSLDRKTGPRSGLVGSRPWLPRTRDGSRGITSIR